MWRNLLSLKASPQVAESFALLFPGSEFIQGRRFTRLHRLILELDQGSITEEIQNSPKSIDTRDLDGWTPLHWACRRGNYQAMGLLLTNGADPHLLNDTEHRNALHLATQSNSFPCIEKLLQHRRGNLVLNIDARDIYGNSPLWIAAEYNCVAALATLIRHGADLNSCDRFNTTPLLKAASDNSHEAITQLVNAGADYQRRDSFGNTILHLAASQSDAETLILLKRARIRGVDVEAKNDEGHTAAEIAALTHGDNETLRKCFERLIGSISTTAGETEEVEELVSETSGGESWKSFEDGVWDEVEQAVK